MADDPRCAEILAVLDALNERARERVGQAIFSLTTDGTTYVVDLLGTEVWDSENDDRPILGPCDPRCPGQGKTHGPLCCQGPDEDGGPREALDTFLPREACKIALEIVRAMEPRPQDPRQMAHDIAEDPTMAAWFRNGNGQDG